MTQAWHKYNRQNCMLIMSICPSTFTCVVGITLCIYTISEQVTIGLAAC